MANFSNPQGFKQYTGTGSSPTYEQVAMRIAQANTTPIFFGDPVVYATGTTGLQTGYITQAAGTGPQALAISGFALANGLVTATFATNTAPPVGSVLILNGLTTGTTLNGAWQIVSSTTTTAVFPYPGAAISTQTTTGYVFQPAVGVFAGCTYQSVAQKRSVWANYWPGSDAAGDVAAYIINDLNAQFSVQTANSNTTSTAVGITAIGQTVGFNYAVNGASPASVNGNTANGISTYFADQYTLAANAPWGQYGQMYLPFRVQNLQNSAISAASPFSGINGNDASTAFNNVVVSFNNTPFKNLTGY